MKFIVIDHGDYDVGLFAREWNIEVNVEGEMSDEQTEVLETGMKKLLKDTFYDGAHMTIFTEEEYERLVKWEESRNET